MVNGVNLNMPTIEGIGSPIVKILRIVRLKAMNNFAPVKYQEAIEDLELVICAGVNFWKFGVADGG